MPGRRETFEGVAIYANLPPRPAQKGLETEDTNYSLFVECDEARFKQLKKDGIPALTALKTYPEDFMNKKTGESLKVEGLKEGTTFIRLKASKLHHKKDGTVLEFDDVPVKHEDGTLVTQSIANGSKVIAVATLDDIKGRSGKALRLRGVVVTDMIVYEGGDPLAEFIKQPATSKKPSVDVDAFFG